MKILIKLIVYKFLLLFLNILLQYFNTRKLNYLKEVLDLNTEELEEESESQKINLIEEEKGIENTKTRTMSYRFLPFQLVKVKYKNAVSNKTSTTFPRPRSGHRICCSSSHIYVFGGFNPNIAVNNDNDEDEAFCLFQELWQYNLITKEWKLLLNAENNLPLELASNAMTIFGNTLMVFGGTGFPFGVNCSNKLYCYNSAADSITQPSSTDLVSMTKQMDEIQTTGDLPTAQYGQAILVSTDVDGVPQLYTIGGTEGFDYTCDIFRLNLLTKVWECVYVCRPDIREDPPGRYRHELAYYNKCIYIFGGGTSDSAFALDRIPTFDLNGCVWMYTKTKPDPNFPQAGYPKARKCHSCVQYEHEVVIAGGYDGRHYFRDIWKFNLKTLQWRFMQKAILTYPIFFHDATVDHDGCMYIFGGIKYNQSNIRTDVLYKMWITIPKLSAICWDALLNYYPKISKCPREMLLENGIPLKFVERIHPSMQ
uniref:Putative scruin like at the midline n=1 Tax=Corethrella appendiculata TaxID=1370023 RepID=U5ETG6_9DIPT